MAGLTRLPPFGLGKMLPFSPSSMPAFGTRKFVLGLVVINCHTVMTERSFPSPWTVKRISGGLKVCDANGQTLAHVYGHADPHDVATTTSLTLDEARRIASNIAKLPTLLGKAE